MSNAIHRENYPVPSRDEAVAESYYSFTLYSQRSYF